MIGKGLFVLWEPQAANAKGEHLALLSAPALSGFVFWKKTCLQSNYVGLVNAVSVQQACSLLFARKFFLAQGTERRAAFTLTHLCRTTFLAVLWKVHLDSRLLPDKWCALASWKSI